MVLRKVANPGPSVLALVNPRKRRSKMATRKRKSSVRRRRSANPINPTRRRKLSTRRRPRRSSIFASSRRRNPVRRRRIGGRRRRNPILGGGVLGEAVNFSIAGFAIGAAQPIVAPLIARFLPLGNFTVPVSSAATGYLLGWLAGKGPAFTRSLARPLQVMGIAVGVTALAGPLVRQWLGKGSAVGNGMSGIAAVHGIPPTVVALPPPPPSRVNGGMAGLGMRPGAYAR